ncbi:MAG: hypothetical protein ACRDYD_06970 [Acidimicrobiales bacterium]
MSDRVEASSVGGAPISGSDRPSRSFAPDRVCAEPGCGTRLSIYNDGRFCYLHEPMTVTRTRGRKIA